MIPSSRYDSRFSTRRIAILSGLAASATGLSAVSAAEPRDVFTEAVTLFFDCRPSESSDVFDRLVVLRPDDEPSLWQRGLALYYAGRFADGRRQFESHRTVNPNDVENAAWHFLCVAREQDAAAAREAILPVGPDARVPMAEIHRLFTGDGSIADVLAAAERGPAASLRNQRCYAHLYIGLHREALGDAVGSRDHILRAAIDHSMDHYMGRVAKVHAILRGYRTKEELQP